MMPRPEEELLRPARSWFIVLTLFLALVLNLLPWQGLSLLLRPDFVALILLFWCINQPRKVGLFAAWLLGLAMDVGDASLFGQHAFAYTLAAYAAHFLCRRIQRFTLWQQAMHVVIVLLATQLVMLLVRYVAGSAMPGWVYFLPSLSGAVLWPGLTLLLLMPQRMGKPEEAKRLPE
jgi:rod shape-determining protein MreD